MELRYDDNPYKIPDNSAGFLITVLGAKGTLESKRGTTVYAATAATEIGRFNTSYHGDNYEDIQLLGQVDWGLSRKLEVSLGTEYLKEHDDRGSTDAPDTGEADQWNSAGIRGKLLYGNEGAKGRIELEAWQENTRYKEEVIAYGEDKNTSNISGTFYYQLFPKTRLLFEARFETADYKFDNSKDRNKSTYSVGAEWSITAKTGGTVKVRRFRKDMDAKDRKDVSEPSWEVMLNWVPIERTTISFGSAKKVEDSTGQGDMLIKENYSASWKHKLSPRISANIGISLEETDYIGDPVSRLDNKKTFEFGMAYKMRRWLTINADITSEGKKSNIDKQNYDRNIFSITLNMVL
ncbi:MAG: outer membrane beta-barrel protein [Gammaproteobacteria bacterium]|nr:outer membrane beta-barrel protein [Gammaproteobacteria bacterium]